jgi:hypothetical protein
MRMLSVYYRRRQYVHHVRRHARRFLSIPLNVRVFVLEAVEQCEYLLHHISVIQKWANLIFIGWQGIRVGWWQLPAM